MSDEVVGIRLKEVLAERGKSQRWLADQLGATRSYVSQLATGTTAASLKRWAEIAGLIGVPVGSLFDDGSGVSTDGKLDELSRRLELLESVKPGATPPPDTEPGAAAILADEALQRALGVYPLSDDDRIFLGGLRLGCGREVADAARWLGHFRAWQHWVRSGADSAPAGG